MKQGLILRSCNFMKHYVNSLHHEIRWHLNEVLNKNLFDLNIL